MGDLTLGDDARRLNSPPLQGRGRGWGLSANRLVELKRRARDMRTNGTTPEARLWKHLSRSQLGGFKFRRQAVMGPFILDFFCPERGVAVEVDGDTHDPARDARRDAWLETQGVRVVRVSNAEVMRELDGVLQTILGVLIETPCRWRGPTPGPSPEGEGR